MYRPAIVSSLVLLFGAGPSLAAAPEAEPTGAASTPVAAQPQTRPAAPTSADPAKLVQGGDEPRYATQEDLESLKDVLEEKITRGVASRYLVNFSGFLTPGFSWVPNQYDTVRLVNANIRFAGFLREDPVDDGDLRYVLSFFYAGPSNTGGAGGVPAGTTGSSVQVTDGVLLWDLVRQKKNLEPTFTATFTLGQQLVPFGSDNTATEDKLPTINLAQYLGQYGLRRDVGLTIDGNVFTRYDAPTGVAVPLVYYALGVYDGQQSSVVANTPAQAAVLSATNGANKWDDNKAKDLVAKILITPQAHFFEPLAGLTFGGSYYRGNVGQDTLRKERVGAELSYLHKPFLVTAEYVRGWDELIDTAKATQLKRSQSVVGTLFYTATTLPDFQPLVRVDYLDRDLDRPNQATTVGTLGFNYYFWQTEPITRRTYDVQKTERVVKLQFNWNRVWDQASATSNQFVAQLVASF